MSMHFIALGLPTERERRKQAGITDKVKSGTLTNLGPIFHVQINLKNYTCIARQEE